MLFLSHMPCICPASCTGVQYSRDTERGLCNILSIQYWGHAIIHACHTCVIPFHELYTVRVAPCPYMYSTVERLYSIMVQNDACPWPCPPARCCIGVWSMRNTNGRNRVHTKFCDQMGDAHAQLAVTFQSPSEASWRLEGSVQS